MDLIALAHSHEIGDNTAKEFVLTQFTPAIEIFVACKNGRFYGYLNRCPHTGVNLNWQPDQFFDFHNEYVQCCIHGALFRVDNGYCVRGPCAGLSLKAVNIVIQSGVLYYKGNPNET